MAEPTVDQVLQAQWRYIFQLEKRQMKHEEEIKELQERLGGEDSQPVDGCQCSV